jgi:hypothetical protein
MRERCCWRSPSWTTYGFVEPTSTGRPALRHSGRPSTSSHAEAAFPYQRHGVVGERVVVAKEAEMWIAHAGGLIGPYGSWAVRSKFFRCGSVPPNCVRSLSTFQLDGAVSTDPRKRRAAARITARACTVPSASPFSKSPCTWAIWLVTCAKQSTGFWRAVANA